MGGCLGGAARLVIDRSVDSGAWPWDILAINIVGSAALGAIAGWTSVRGKRWWSPAVGPGLLGGFTTFSAMAAPHPDAPWPAIVSLIVAVLTCAAAAGYGWFAGRRAADARAIAPAGVRSEP